MLTYFQNSFIDIGLLCKNAQLGDHHALKVSHCHCTNLYNTYSISCTLRALRNSFNCSKVDLCIHDAFRISWKSVNTWWKLSLYKS